MIDTRDFLEVLALIDFLEWEGTMKIVIAPDSFKESLTAEEVAQAIKEASNSQYRM